MGGKFSKSTVEAPPPMLSLPANLSNLNPAPSELSSYEAACRADSDLRTFDTTLQARTTRVFSTLAAAGGVDLHALSFESLKEVTGCIFDTNQEVVKMILEYQKDIWKNPELFELVQDYFETSLQTLDFCTVLEKCLRRARDSQLILQVALRHFEEEEGVRNVEMDDGGGGRKYLKTMEELKNFKNAGDPFTEEFFQVFQSVHRQQIVMLQKLNLRKRKVDKKIRRAKAWRKVSGIIFAAACAAVLICSVVAAAMAAPPVAAALAAAASVPVGSMGKWLDSLWKGYEVALRDERGIISVMNVGSIVLIQDLESIRVLVERMNIEISSLMASADFSLKDDVALKFGIEEIKKKMGVFMQSIEDLSEHADRCSRDIRRARTVVLQRIIKQPN